MNLTGIVGKKLYQSQGFLQDGTRVPLSVVFVPKNLITQIKGDDKEGYNAVQIGIGEKKSRKRGADKQLPRFFREIRLLEQSDLEKGQEINAADVLSSGDIVDVTGVSKGKGFAGVVKRHHFKGGPRTHGQSDRERAPGSIGQTTTPGRVYKGKRMAGRMGKENVTLRNLEVLNIVDDGTVFLKGLIPGGKNGLVIIKKVGVNKKFQSLYKEEIATEPLEEQKEEIIEKKEEETKESVVEENVEEKETVKEEPLKEEENAN
jgi:large subunit ribosomal protein L3